MRNTVLLLLLAACLSAEDTTVSFTYSNDYFGFAKQDDNRTSEMSIRIDTGSVLFDIEHSMLTDRTSGTRLDEATGKVGWRLQDVVLGAGIRIRGDEAGEAAQNFVHRTIGQDEEHLSYDGHEVALIGWWESNHTLSFLRAETAGTLAYDTLNVEALAGIGYDWKNVGVSVLGGYECYKTDSDSSTLQNVADGEDGWTAEVNARLYFLNFKLRTNLDSGNSYGSFIFEYRL